MHQPSTDLVDLAVLIAAVARRDQSAFRQLYDRTAAKLLGIVLRIVRDRATAEDVVQEVFVSVWKKSAQFDASVGRPMTWLISMARNRAIDHLRQGRVLAGSDCIDSLVHLSDGRDPASEHADLARLRSCLDLLDPTHRRCLLDAYYVGYSRDELAERFAKPVGTIKTWLHRGVASLRTCLEAG